MRSAPAVVALLALAVTLPSSLRAQGEPAGRLYVGGGIGFRALSTPDGDLRDEGLVVHAGLLRTFSRLGVRLAVTYYGSGGSCLLGRSLSSCGGTAAGAAAELAYDISRARVRPYVVGGWGYYRVEAGPRMKEAYTGALMAGAGIAFDKAFVEARFHEFPEGRGALLPLTFGVRF